MTLNSNQINYNWITIKRIKLKNEWSADLEEEFVDDVLAASRAGERSGRLWGGRPGGRVNLRPVGGASAGSAVDGTGRSVHHRRVFVHGHGHRLSHWLQFFPKNSIKSSIKI